MTKKIQTILIPVDFSVNTDTAINKALNIAALDSCVIHLLHVQQISTSNIFGYLLRVLKGYSWKQVRAEIKSSEERLHNLKSDIESMRKNITVYVSVCYGDSVEDFITKKASNLAVDLIVVGKSSHHSKFPRLNTVIPGRIAQMTGIPVLTAKPGSRNREVKKVVVPVSAEFSTGKMAIIKALQSRNPIQIQLVIFPDDDVHIAPPRQALLNIFQTLKSQLAIPVKYIRLHGANKAKALLAYSESIGADMIIVHPGSETRVDSWRNRHMSDILPAESQTLILSVR